MDTTMTRSQQTLLDAFTDEYQLIGPAVKASTGRKPGGAQRIAYHKAAQELVALGILETKANESRMNLYRIAR
jgi:hypothetical protein